MSLPHAGRLRTVVLLLAVLFGLSVWYGTYGVAPELGAYPTEQVVGPTPGQFVGDSVTVSGTVVSTDPVEIRIAYRGTQRRTLTVTDVDTAVERGDQLRVFGTLVDERTVQATRVVTVSPGEFLYAYVVSFLGGLWVLARFVTQWRLDATQGFVRRADPLTLGALRTHLTTETTDDA